MPVSSHTFLPDIQTTMLPSPLLASAAKSFFLTLHISQYNVLAADLASNLKVWSRGSGACGKKEGKNAAALPGCMSWRHDLEDLPAWCVEC